MSNYYANRKGKKGTGEHALSNADLKAMLQKEGHLPEPCYECGSTERIGTACKPCNPELALILTSAGEVNRQK